MVDPVQMYRRRPDEHETEDLALTFLEEEVGRFDWLANWKVIKEGGTALSRVRGWLSALGIEHEPEAIVGYLDDLARDRTGRWR